MKWLMISCKQATYLISKKEATKLNLAEKIRLGMHLFMCSICRRFEQQSNFIGRMARKMQVHAELPETSKEKMKHSLHES